eukprot:5326932-Pyramimonas_sp.AAC.1
MFGGPGAQTGTRFLQGPSVERGVDVASWAPGHLNPAEQDFHPASMFDKPGGRDGLDNRHEFFVRCP